MKQCKSLQSYWVHTDSQSDFTFMVELRRTLEVGNIKENTIKKQQKLKTVD
jgi:hypothetical protein